MWKLNFKKFISFVCLVSLKVTFTSNNAEDGDRKVQQLWKETSKFCKFNLTTILKLSPRRKVRNLNLPEPFHRGQRQSRGPRTGQTGCTAGGSCSRLYNQKL